MLKIYEYKNCDTCRKALKYLDTKGVAYEKVPIRETPPTKDELRRMLGYLGGQRKKLFNISGGDYKALGLKDKLDGMTEAQAIDLLASNGNLVKRPFVISKSAGWVGFDPKAWDASLSK